MPWSDCVQADVHITYEYVPLRLIRDIEKLVIKTMQSKKVDVFKRSRESDGKMRADSYVVYM